MQNSPTNLDNSANLPLSASRSNIHEAEARMQFMLDTVPIMITFWDTSFNMVECNQEILRKLGINSKREYMQDFYKFSPTFQPDGSLSRKRVRDLVAETFAKGRLEFEWTHKDINGRLIPVKVISISGQYKGQTLVFAYATDISEIKAANERTRMMFEAAPIIVEYWNKNFDCVDCNAATVKFYQLSNKLEYREKVSQLMPLYQPDGSPSWKHWLSCLNRTFDEGYLSFEFVTKKSCGEEALFEVIAVRMDTDIEPMIITYSVDVSERLHASVAEENSRAKSRFLARMSHEIRTPITAVLGISEIQLQNPNLSLPIEEAFNKIYTSAKILLDIINDILDFSAIEAGKMELQSEKYEVASLVGDVTQLQLVHLGSKKIKFQINADADIPSHLIGDPLRIKQVLNNVLSNAFKYTDTGSVELGLQYQHDPEDEDNITLLVTIRDTGRGMTTEQIEALYSEYTRFHTQENRFIAGTGLGMSIVYSLMQLMDADIDVQSTVGEGTTVALSIPQKIASLMPIGSETVESLQSLEKGLRTEKPDFVIESMPYATVLVVDDVDANLYVSKGLLNFYDIKVETCTGGYDALEKISNGTVYDIVFMDHMMPDLDGMETTRVMRARGYTAPIVALTANALIGQAEEFMKNGFDGFLSKPIRARHLNNILNKFIRNKQPKEVLEEMKLKGDQKDIENFLKDANLLGKLQMDFLSTQRDAFVSINKFIEAGDIKTAHRLAHTLKGLAGLIHENSLETAAADVEKTLAIGEIPSTSRMGTFEGILDSVIERLEKLSKDIEDTKEPPPRPVVYDKDQSEALYNRLYGLLSSRNADSLQWVNDLSVLPGTEMLIQQIRAYDFKAALKSLETLRKEQKN